MVADALARVTVSLDAGLTWFDNNEPQPGLVPVTLSLIHAAMAVTAAIFLLVSRRTNCAWSLIGDLLALATKSTPSPIVQNTGAGVGRFSTWRHNVQVRDVGNGSVELVFPKDGHSTQDLRKAMLNEKYS